MGKRWKAQRASETGASNNGTCSLITHSDERTSTKRRDSFSSHDANAVLQSNAHQYNKRYRWERWKYKRKTKTTRRGWLNHHQGARAPPRRWNCCSSATALTANIFAIYKTLKFLEPMASFWRLATCLYWWCQAKASLVLSKTITSHNASRSTKASLAAAVCCQKKRAGSQKKRITRVFALQKFVLPKSHISFIAFVKSFFFRSLILNPIQYILTFFKIRSTYSLASSNILVVFLKYEFGTL